MQYRFAAEKDIDLLAEWNHQLIRDEGHRNSMTILELRKRMMAWLTEEYKAVVFEIDFGPVAYALYREDAREIYLRQFFVHRHHRRRGIGRKAVHVLRTGIWPSDKRLTVEVLTANTSGIAFWRSMGYQDYCLTLEVMPTTTSE